MAQRVAESYLVISLSDRVLSVVTGGDTLASIAIGVAAERTLTYGGQTWRFRTPRGARRIARRVVDPVWVPPDWHYAETAWHYGLRLTWLRDGATPLSNGAQLLMREHVAGLLFPDGEFAELPIDEHIVFDGKLFIPPMGSLNRQVAGHLGRYALDLGQGYMIHGTTDAASIGKASTHGCIRVADDDMRWLYENVSVGTRVLIR
jgi:lipoprotein-anchoring transpeptidase ErfK/SrfK